MKLILTILIIAFFAMSCNKKQPVKNDLVATTAKDTADFKKWLSDTLPLIKSKTPGTEIVIPKDSTYMDIRKHYDEIIIPNQHPQDKEIESALWLLKTNDSVPDQKFNLSFDVIRFYNFGFPKIMIDHSYEIENFIVRTPTKEIKYQFNKGNLTDKKATVLGH